MLPSNVSLIRQPEKNPKKVLMSPCLLYPVIVRVETSAVPCHPIFRSEPNIAPYTATGCQCNAKVRKNQKKFIVSMYVVSVVARIETFAVPRHPIFRSEPNIAPHTATECQSKKKNRKKV